MNLKPGQRRLESAAVMISAGTVTISINIAFNQNDGFDLITPTIYPVAVH